MKNAQSLISGIKDKRKKRKRQKHKDRQKHRSMGKSAERNKKSGNIRNVICRYSRNLSAVVCSIILVGLVN
jgi:hypothetical protein